LLAYQLFPDRTHYGPIDADALGRYPLFSRLGFFGVTPGTTRGAATFLRVSQAILQRPKTVIWITPEGQFTDPRQRPVRLQPGVSHLARRLDHGAFVPVALEYPFWQERFPEVLVRFGDVIEVTPARSRTVEAYTALLASSLADTQDALAREACRQDPDTFDVLLRGRVGIGGVYDLWRSWRARLRGDTFRKSHGTKE
jgi:1-acyl-sn-glycerol-3-phosphate acyltransferase